MGHEDDPGGYKEAKAILDRAEVMFKSHTKAMTGNEWDFAAAGEDVRTIWIIKAVRET